MSDQERHGLAASKPNKKSRVYFKKPQAAMSSVVSQLFDQNEDPTQETMEGYIIGDDHNSILLMDADDANVSWIIPYHRIDKIKTPVN